MRCILRRLRALHIIGLVFETVRGFGRRDVSIFGHQAVTCINSGRLLQKVIGQNGGGNNWKYSRLKELPVQLHSYRLQRTD